MFEISICTSLERSRNVISIFGCQLSGYHPKYHQSFQTPPAVFIKVVKPEFQIILFVVTLNNKNK